MLLIFGCAGSLLLHGLFSSYGERGLLSSCGVQASRCHGFSCFAAWAHGHTGFSHCDTRAPLLRSKWDPPGSGIRLVCPALAGGFFTTEPPGKPLRFIFLLESFFS